MTGDLLRAAVASARKSALEREKTTPEVVLASVEHDSRSRVRFRDALAAPGLRVIAECKRRSPSRGVLRQNYDPAAIARAYERAGAAAISVLTEPTFFDGSLDHLRAVRAAVRRPLLCKDFIVTPFQIAEARHAGADAVLLIAAALADAELRGLIDTAASHELDALVEVHDADELHRALDAGAAIVGVNSRNLRTLEVSLDVFERLAPMIPAGVVAVAESGLKRGDDLRRLRDLRYDAFLIGERFMTAANPGDALEELLAPTAPAGREGSA